MSSRILRHVVLFGFEDPGVAREVTSRFSALKDTIPQVSEFECGVNSSPEGLNKGLSHCFLVSFKSENDRDVYLTHPDHLEFSNWVGPHLSAVTVVDYWIDEI